MIAMAKKTEFRPDKSRNTLLSHLILTQKQRKSVLKWSLYAFILIFLSVVQDVLLSRVRIFGATTELVPCAIFLICVLEGAQNSCIFALISSLLYLFSGTAAGPYSMIAITFLSIIVCVLRQAFLQPSFPSAMLCVAVAMFVYVLVNFFFGLFLGLTLFVRFHGFLMTAVLSLLVAPVLYPLFKSIGAIGGQSWKE